MAAVERRFHAMGGGCHVVCVAPSRARAAAAAADAEALVRDLERRWSRFRPDSELSRLNAAGALDVSAETYDVVARAVAAWHATAGRFDPTVDVAALGYDRSYALCGGTVTVRRPAPAPGCAGIELAGSAVALPAGVRLDLGAVGKGRAADLAAERSGADGVCVNVGGDLRVRGTPPAGDAWVVGVDEGPALAVADGGVATSSPAAKTFGAGVTHVVDPATGASLATDVTAAIVVAGEAWWAEVLATYALALGVRRAPEAVRALGGAALLRLPSGGVRIDPSLEPYLAVAS